MSSAAYPHKTLSTWPDNTLRGQDWTIVAA